MLGFHRGLHKKQLIRYCILFLLIAWLFESRYLQIFVGADMKKLPAPSSTLSSDSYILFICLEMLKHCANFNC